MAEGRCTEKQQSVLIQRVEIMESVIELLLETLTQLTDTEFKRFRQFLLSEIDFDRPSSNIPWRLLMMRDKEDTVFLMVLIYGALSVEMIKEHLKYMRRTDLEKRLPYRSPLRKKRHQSALIQKVAMMTAVKQVLLETLDDLSNDELKEFLELIVSQNNLPGMSWMMSNTADIVEEMVETYGQQSMDLTREVVTKMNRTDLMQKLSKPSSGLKEKHSVDEHQAALSERVLKNSLNDLSVEELGKFKWLLQFTCFKKGLPHISWSQLDRADTVDALVNLMVENQQSVEVTKEVLMDMNRIDLMKRLSETSSGLKEKQLSKPIQKAVTMTSVKEKLLETVKDLSSGELMDRKDLFQDLSDTSSGSKRPSKSLEPVGCGSNVEDSSDWTKLEPEVDSTGADEAPIYSLQSEAGSFECNVSGFRWICKEKVSFKYQFCSLEEHMERIKSMQYMPAGPLMDITVLAGRFFEVYLPHWISIVDNPTILDKFAVLHIDDCGDVVENVSEVTSSHVKLSEPVFSLRMVLVRFGLSIEVNCNVSIFKTDISFLTLHVYLIPRDPGLQQKLEQRELSYGYKVIRKPHPEKSLKMNDWFILSTDLDGAEICPQKLMLRYESTEPNFFEVFINNPDTNFHLNLTKENERQPVWTCAIRKDEYQSTVHIQETPGPSNADNAVIATLQSWVSSIHTTDSCLQSLENAGASTSSSGEHFVNEHRSELIDRVSNIEAILDELLDKKVITLGNYDEILAIPTSRGRMRKLYSGPLNSAGHDGKEVFYKLLEEKEKYLIAELKKKK